MANWVCPECGRTFGRTGQGHTCSPGLSIEEFFAVSQPWERPIFDKLHNHIEQLGPVVTEPVQVGVFFKNGPRFAEFRPMKKWVAVTFMLPEKLNNSRLARKVISSGGPTSRWYHVVNIDDANQVDDELLDWISAAYLAAEDGS